jgi:hypothetical protein
MLAPFLGNGSVNTFPRNTTNEHPLLGRRVLIMQQFDYKNGRAVFSAWSVPRDYKRDKVNSVSILRESAKRGLEAEE